MSECHFCSVFWGQIDRMWQNLAYTLILTTSRLGLLNINFRKFITELWSLIDVWISFPRNILKTNRWNLTKFRIKHLYWEDGWDYYTTLFLQILNRLGTLDWCQNFVSAQYLENCWMDFDQMLHMHLYSLALGLINIFYTQYLDKY